MEEKKSNSLNDELSKREVFSTSNNFNKEEDFSVFDEIVENLSFAQSRRFNHKIDKKQIHKMKNFKVQSKTFKTKRNEKPEWIEKHI